MTESKKTSYFITGTKIVNVYQDSDGWIWEGNKDEKSNYFNIILKKKYLYTISF